ncbi:NADH dehydrogenase [Ventosimonas gracilis]|uniref:NADH dehydrogenase n=1 Tax=Ventosimonas gracilis TaxID=1680762 RepID=A0A139SUY4_9GAMM|nr:nitroreductase [Ventosimonas gracilis]KXU38379.1 NADH dehydrogenase [Ventosimonas gracilis]
MNVEQALNLRHSARAFLPQIPDKSLVKQLLEQSAKAASGGNLQPWRVIALSGAPLRELINKAKASEACPQQGMSYPSPLFEPYRSRRFENGEMLYQALRIDREDKAARMVQWRKNGEFFGAPVGIFIAVHQRMGYAQWIDLGIYLQSLMLLACENGLATCAQGYWRDHNALLVKALELPADYQIAFGIALGFEDKSAAVNQWRATRTDFAEWGELRGF